MRLFLIIAIVTSWFWPVDGYADSPQLLPENHRPTEPKISLTLPALPRREHELLPVEQLIERLDDDDSRIRRSAGFDLLYIGEKALPQLKDAMKNGSTSNLRHSARRIVEVIEKPVVLEWNEFLFDRVKAELAAEGAKACKQLTLARERLIGAGFTEVQKDLKSVADTVDPSFLADGRLKALSISNFMPRGSDEVLKASGYEPVILTQLAGTNWFMLREQRNRKSEFELRVVKEPGLPSDVLLVSHTQLIIPLEGVDSAPPTARHRPQYPEMPVLFSNGLIPGDFKGYRVSFDIYPAMRFADGECIPLFHHSYHISLQEGVKADPALKDKLFRTIEWDGLLRF